MGWHSSLTPCCMYTAPWRFCYWFHVQWNSQHKMAFKKKTLKSNHSINKTHPFGYLHLYCILEISCIHIQLMTLHLAKDCRWRSHNSPRPWPWWLQLFFIGVNFSDHLQHVIPKFPGTRELVNCPKQRRSLPKPKVWRRSSMQVCLQKAPEETGNLWKMKDVLFFFWHNLTRVLGSYFSGLLLLRSVQQYQTAKTHGGQLHQNSKPIFTCPVSHV